MISMHDATKAAARFVHAFRCQAYRQPTEADVSAAESALGFKLPSAYRSVVLQCGILDCPHLLDALAPTAPAMPVLQTMAALDEIAPATAAARDVGLPADYFVFGHDPAGSPFCFTATPAPKDTVFYFDADLRTLREVASSIHHLIAQYLSTVHA